MTMPEQLQRVKIWSGRFRFTHLTIGFSTVVLLVTGWLIGNTPSVANSAVEFHYYAASILIFGLVLRVLLAFIGKPVERVGALIP